MPQHPGALIVIMNCILISALLGGYTDVAAGSITTIKLCSMDKVISFYETEMLATELS